jgi:hypothetical protein
VPLSKKKYLLMVSDRGTSILNSRMKNQVKVNKFRKPCSTSLNIILMHTALKELRNFSPLCRQRRMFNTSLQPLTFSNLQTHKELTVIMVIQRHMWKLTTQSTTQTYQLQSVNDRTSPREAVKLYRKRRLHSNKIT